MPIANGFLTPDQFADEYFFKLSAAFCPRCTLVQLAEQPRARADVQRPLRVLLGHLGAHGGALRRAGRAT